MPKTAEYVAAIANRRCLHLSARELAEITAMVMETGSFAPESETVARFKAGALTRGMLTFFVPWLWRDRPDTSPVPNEVWRGMFEQVEYTEDMVVRDRPRRTVRAYRGATAENSDGLAWSLDVEQAKYFARSRQAPGAHAQVWVANIPPQRIFARFIDGWENEVTADARGLDIRPLEDEHLLPRPRNWPWRR